jgi:hypothetical protein
MTETPFEKLFRGRKSELEDVRENQKSGFEDRIVKQILEAGGVRTPHAALQDDATRMGHNELNFAWFHSQYPTFPLRLFHERVLDIHKISCLPHEIRKRVTKTPFYEEIAKILDEGDHFNAVGLVFNWPGFGTALLHNGPPSHHNDFRITKGIGSPVVVWTIEHFSDYLGSLDWTA